MIQRPEEIKILRSLLEDYPVVGIVGARQVGKTTLARVMARQARGSVFFYDLEDPRDMAVMADPMLALEPLRGLVVIDEIQRLPGLFEVLRVLSDRRPRRAKFLVLGSASPDLLRQGSESLAGRIAYHEIGGLTLGDLRPRDANALWVRGGLPASFLASSDARSFEWRQQYVRTFLERDLPQLGVFISAATMRRFWTMLAHYHGQVWNSSEFARAFGVADTTVRGYLDRLISALVVRQLQPWHENVSKRQVKSPKMYLADSGLLHALLNLRTLRDIEANPKSGASWEAFALDQVVRHLGAGREECFFWATHAGAELDLLIVRGALRYGFEFKRTSRPGLTPSLTIAMKDLKLRRLDLVYPGDRTFLMAKNVRAVGLPRLKTDILPLR